MERGLKGSTIIIIIICKEGFVATLNTCHFKIYRHHLYSTGMHVSP